MTMRDTSMSITARAVCATALAASLAACALTPQPTQVHQPMTTRPAVALQSDQSNGAIFQPGGAKLLLFEDRRARAIGDTLTVLLEERNTASKGANSAANRTSETSVSVPTVNRLPGANFQGIGIGASGETSFEGAGTSRANNVFTGFVAVTVIEVFPNGNLLVSGEKQVSINQGTEFIRFSGVINPVNINALNVVSSTRVADARMEYRGRGVLDEANTMGWLQRLFLNVSPY
jgi:flagellar L-ring protein precursor FlgH